MRLAKPYDTHILEGLAEVESAILSIGPTRPVSAEQEGKTRAGGIDTGSRFLRVHHRKGALTYNAPQDRSI